MKKNQKIKCDVSNCKYNDINDCKCNLDEIKIVCNCQSEMCKNKDLTICDNFEPQENE